MSYHGLGNFQASTSISLGPGGLNTSVTSSGLPSGSGKSDYIWDRTCDSRGGVRAVVNKFGEASFVCNDGHACRQPFGSMVWNCTNPSGAKAPPPPPGPKPCGVQISDPCATGTKLRSEKNGYVYTFCKDDTMFVRAPDCSVQKFSQKEVGSALTSGAPRSSTLYTGTLFDVSKVLLAQPEPLATLDVTKATFGVKKPTLYTGTLFRGRTASDVTPSSPPSPPTGEDTMSTGTKVAIGVGVLAVIAGIAYAATRRG